MCQEAEAFWMVACWSWKWWKGLKNWFRSAPWSACWIFFLFGMRKLQKGYNTSLKLKNWFRSTPWSACWIFFLLIMRKLQKRLQLKDKHMAIVLTTRSIRLSWNSIFVDGMADLFNIEWLLNAQSFCHLIQVIRVYLALEDSSIILWMSSPFH